MDQAAIRGHDCRRHYHRRRPEGPALAVPCLVAVWAWAPVRDRVMAVPRAMAPLVTEDRGTAVAQQRHKYEGHGEIRYRSR